MNLKQIEKIMIQHLEESGEIRADLKWLKKSFWALAGVGCMTAGTLMTEMILRGLH